MEIPEAARQRFWEKVEKPSQADCWPWLAGCTSRGYGDFYYDGKQVRAHRFAYELLVGPIPEGLQLDHLCRVRHCVNPQHLEPVTHRENVLRGIGPTAEQARRTHCIHGHPFSEDNLRIGANGRRYCRACVNKRHRQDTKSEMDGLKRQPGQRRLTKARAGELRELRASGLTYRELAERFSVSKWVVRDVVKGRTYAC